jgi:hypothetical protein
MFTTNLIEKCYQKCSNYKFVLFFYHLFFSFLAYQLRVNRGVSDSHSYWAQNININAYSWFDFADYGANFILFLNYPLLKLGLPFWFGFFIYSLVGYFGILKWIAFSERVLGTLMFKGYDLLPVLFFLPNLHYWTATLGKEPLVFLAIASIFNFLVAVKTGKIQVAIAFLLLLLIRPHVALLLLFSILVVVIFQKKYDLKKRVVLLISSLGLFSVLSYMVLQLTSIRYWDWNRIVYFNDYSILSFRNSRAYVPMLDYSIWYQLFSFNFRPLFFDAYTIWTFLASFENFLQLFFYGFAFVIFIKHFKKITLPDWAKIVILFTLVSSLIYVQRYANLGIFMRTKIMFQPFMWVCILLIIKQGLTFRKI